MAAPRARAALLLLAGLAALSGVLICADAKATGGSPSITNQPAPSAPAADATAAAAAAAGVGAPLTATEPRLAAPRAAAAAAGGADAATAGADDASAAGAAAAPAAARGSGSVASAAGAMPVVGGWANAANIPPGPMTASNMRFSGSSAVSEKGGGAKGGDDDDDDYYSSGGKGSKGGGHGGSKGSKGDSYGSYGGKGGGKDDSYSSYGSYGGKDSYSSYGGGKDDYSSHHHGGKGDDGYDDSYGKAADALKGYGDLADAADGAPVVDPKDLVMSAKELRLFGVVPVTLQNDPGPSQVIPLYSWAGSNSPATELLTLASTESVTVPIASTFVRSLDKTVYQLTGVLTFVNENDQPAKVVDARVIAKPSLLGGVTNLAGDPAAVIAATSGLFTALNPANILGGLSGTLSDLLAGGGDLTGLFDSLFGGLPLPIAGLTGGVTGLFKKESSRIACYDEGETTDVIPAHGTLTCLYTVNTTTPSTAAVTAGAVVRYGSVDADAFFGKTLSMTKLVDFADAGVSPSDGTLTIPEPPAATSSRVLLKGRAPAPRLVAVITPQGKVVVKDSEDVSDIIVNFPTTPLVLTGTQSIPYAVEIPALCDLNDCSLCDPGTWPRTYLYSISAEGYPGASTTNPVKGTSLITVNVEQCPRPPPDENAPVDATPVDIVTQVRDLLVQSLNQGKLEGIIDKAAVKAAALDLSEAGVAPGRRGSRLSELLNAAAGVAATYAPPSLLSGVAGASSRVGLALPPSIADAVASSSSSSSGGGSDMRTASQNRLAQLAGLGRANGNGNNGNSNARLAAAFKAPGGGSGGEGIAASSASAPAAAAPRLAAPDLKKLQKDAEKFGSAFARAVTTTANTATQVATAVAATTQQQAQPAAGRRRRS